MHSVLTDSYVELLSLSKKCFYSIFFHQFREFGSELYQNALKRRIRMEEIYQRAKNFYINNIENAEKRTMKPRKLSLKFNSELNQGNDNLSTSKIFKHLGL